MEKLVPTLILFVEKGPRKGETVECKPGNNVRIGRIVRGNTFPIKDTSISQKHLSVELVDGTRWAVTDLETSNGTLLNDVQIEPLVSTDLCDGDVIKIGKDTSIAVRIDKVSETEIVEVAATRLRKNPRRGGVSDEPKKEVVSIRGRGRPNRAINASSLSKQGPLDPVADCAPEQSEKQLKRRRIQRVENSNCAVDDDDDEEEERSNLIAEESVKEPKKNTAVVRRGRGAPKKKRTTTTTSSRALDSIREESEKESLKVVENTNCNDANAVKLEQSDIAVEESLKELNIAVRKGRGASKRTKATARSSREQHLGTEDHGGAIGREEAATAEELNEDDRVDMENMSLGEWFDWMEKYMPKVINNIAEEIISEMKVKAERFNEYVGKISYPG